MRQSHRDPVQTEGIVERIRCKCTAEILPCEFVLHLYSGNPRGRGRTSSVTCLTYVRWEYGAFTVAKAFLKYPTPNHKRIEAALAEYKRSDGYARRVEKSRPKERERRDADTLANPDDPVGTARRLRSEFMNAHRHANNMWAFCVPTQETVDRYRAGALLDEANDATRRSGYGAIRNEKTCIVEMLRPAAFEDDMPDDV